MRLWVKWLPCGTTILCVILDPTWKAVMQRVLGLETKIRRKRKEFNRKASSFMPWYEMVSIRCRLHNASLHLLVPLLPLIHGSARELYRMIGKNGSGVVLLSMREGLHHEKYQTRRRQPPDTQQVPTRKGARKQKSPTQMGQSLRENPDQPLR